MSVKVIIPAPLRQYTEKNDSVLVDGQTVDEVLQNLTERYGDLRKHLYSDEGKLRSFVNIYRNDDDIRYLDKGSTAVKETDVLSIIPSIAGGGPAGPGAPAMAGGTSPIDESLLMKGR